MAEKKDSQEEGEKGRKDEEGKGGKRRKPGVVTEQTLVWTTWSTAGQGAGIHAVTEQGLA